MFSKNQELVSAKELFAETEIYRKRKQNMSMDLKAQELKRDYSICAKEINKEAKLGYTIAYCPLNNDVAKKLHDLGYSTAKRVTISNKKCMIVSWNKKVK